MAMKRTASGSASAAWPRDQAGAAQSVGGIATVSQGERTGAGPEASQMATAMRLRTHSGGVAARVHQEGEARLFAQRFDNRTNEEGAEQALGHGAQGVDAIAFAGNDDVFSFQKCLQLIHCYVLFSLNLHMS